MKILLPKKDPNIVRSGRYREYPRIYSKLDSYVTKILQAHHLQPRKVTLWDRGISSFVFVLGGKKKLALKISPRYSLFSEAKFYQKARQAGIPVPKLFAVDTSKKLIPYEYHITEWIVGKIPDELNSKDLYRCAFELGRMFVRLHQIKMDGFGLPTSKGWSHKSWLSALKEFSQKEASLKEMKKLFGHGMVSILGRILRDPKMDIHKPRLTHSDTGEDQFLVIKKNGKWMVEGVLDPGYFISGDPLIDLAGAMITWNKSAYRRGFYDGYISTHSLKKEEQYRLLRLRFLSQAWGATVVNRTNKKDGSGMAQDALKLAKKIG